MPLLSNVAGLIDSCNVGPLTVHRPGLPTLNQFGGYTDAADVTFDLDPVAVHNLSGRDIDRAPEADRHSELIQLYSKVRLFVADDGQIPDRVVYRSRTWRVVRVQDYDLQGGVYCAMAALEDT